MGKGKGKEIAPDDSSKLKRRAPEEEDFDPTPFESADDTAIQIEVRTHLSFLLFYLS